MDKDKVIDSKSFERAKSRASEYANDPEKLRGLLDKATHRANKKEGMLGGIWESLNALLRLLKAYSKGEYRDVSWQSLLLIIASIVYFVMPIDFIPDFILALGFIDDAALIAWTAKTVKSDVDNFVRWEKEIEKQS